MKITESPIISCSRRTDVPAFLMDWIIERVQEGYVDVVNPFNKTQISRVSLNPKHVKCFVWWSKNFEQWINSYLENKELFKRFKGHAFQFTINSPSELESNITISLEDRFEQVKWIIKEFGLLAMNYRFDPIILYKNKDSNKVKGNLNRFEYIIEQISSLGLKEMIFSFATLYAKVRKRMSKRGRIPIDISFKKKKEIINQILSICNDNDIQLFACCQPDLLEIEGINQAHCIDANRIEKLLGVPIPKKRDTGQRESCGCYKSKDIGGYDGIFRCKHNCDYCYASPAKY